MGEQIEINEIINETKDLSTENKSFGKLQKLAEKLIKKLNDTLSNNKKQAFSQINLFNEQTQKKLDNFIEATNKGLDAYKKRNDALYSDLCRRILVKMETRLFNLELFNQAILDLTLQELYELKKKTLPEGATIEDFNSYVKEMAKKHETIMQKHADEFVKKMKETENVAIQEENKKD